MSELLQSGPCAVCGLRNYTLSYGGPTICPACDVGDSGPSRMNAQRARIEELERELALAVPYAEGLRAALVALEQAYSNKHSPQHRAACLAEARAALAAKPVPAEGNV